MPKPRILGADGAGIVVSGEGFAAGDRVVINPGHELGNGKISVVGEHSDGTHAELIAVPRSQVYPLPDAIDFETAAAFPLVFETAYRMLATRAGLQEGEWVLVWGIGGGVATATLAIAKALGARVIVTSSSADKLARARELGADGDVQPRDGRRRRRREGADRRRCARRRRRMSARRRGNDRSTRSAPKVASASAARPRGPNPPANLHRIWWKQLTILGSTMGTRADFEAVYDLVASGRATPVVDQVFPLAEAAAAHERLEAGEQLGKIVLRIPG